MPTLIDQELYPKDSGIEDANRPRTMSVLIVLMFAATTISYLAAYAMPSALVAANVVNPWPSSVDPRPRWMVMSFFALMGSFVLLHGMFRLLGRFQNRQIDAMMED